MYSELAQRTEPTVSDVQLALIDAGKNRFAIFCAVPTFHPLLTQVLMSVPCQPMQNVHREGICIDVSVPYKPLLVRYGFEVQVIVPICL